MENYDLLPRVGCPLRQTPNTPYPKASSKTETELKSDVIPLQFQNPKRIDVFELLMEQWKTMTPPACWLPALAKSKQSIPRGEF